MGNEGVVVKSGRCHTAISLTMRREVHQRMRHTKLKIDTIMRAASVCGIKILSGEQNYGAHFNFRKEIFFVGYT